MNIYDKFHGNPASNGEDVSQSTEMTNQKTEWLTDFYLCPSGVNDDDDDDNDNDDDGNIFWI